MSDLPIGDPRPSGQPGPAGDQRPSGSDAPAGDPRPAGAETLAPPYDPAEHTVEQVNDHLATLADDDPERQRILDAERDGKARAGILDD